MSLLEKLTIRGIRNFGTDLEDEQRINFQSPLTVILGQNGCGKTTIIECIKYALTGQLPPNCKDGHSFIHDPKVTSNVESLGQVKLQVQTSTRDKVTVCRSAKVTTSRGKVKPQFKTMDTTLNIQKNGKDTTISKRCVDVSLEMCNAMGVSKAIIDNVLFCHQEDSSWPLGTDKELKEKFDAIFGTTEYNKGVESIRKKRKKIEDQVKNKAVDLKELEMKKKETESKMGELQSLKENLVLQEDNYKKIGENIKPVEDRIAEIKENERKIGEMCSKKAKMESDYENNIKRQQSISEKIKDLFMGSEETLQEKMQSFKEQKSTTKERLVSFERDLQKTNIEWDKVNDNIRAIEADRAVFIDRRSKEQDCYAERGRNIQKLCDNLNITVDCNLENSNEQHNELLDRIKAKVLSEEENLSDLSAANECLDIEQQTAIDLLRVKLTAAESELVSKRNQLKQLTRDKANFESKIKNSEGNERKVEIIKANLAKIVKLEKEMSDSVNSEALKTEICTKKEELKTLRAELEDMDTQIQFLNSVSVAMAEITTKERQFNARDKEIRHLKNKNINKLREVFGSDIGESNFKQRLNDVNQTVQAECNQLESEIKSNQQLRTESQINSKNKKNELNNMQTEIKVIEDRIGEYCTLDSFEDVLQRQRDYVDELKFLYGTEKSSEVLYKKYIQDIGLNSCCPLCHKDMITGEVTDITDELQTELRKLPKKIELSEKRFKEENRKLEALLALQRDVERLTKLTQTDLPNLKTLVADLDKKLLTARDEVNRLEQAIVIPSFKQETINDLNGDMVLLDKAIEEKTRLQNEIAECRNKLPAQQSELTIDEASRRRKELNDNSNAKQQEIDDKQKYYDDRCVTINKLCQRQTELKQEMLKLEEDRQSLAQYRQRIDELSKQCVEIEADIKQQEVQLRPVKNNLQKAIDTKQRSKRENSEKLSKEQRRIQGIRKLNDDVKRITTEIEKLSAEKLVEKIEKYRIELNKLQQYLKEKDAEIERIGVSIDKLKKEISGQEMIERDLMDNIELKKLQKETEELKEKLIDLNNSMGNKDSKRLGIELGNLVKKRDDLFNNRSSLSGAMNEVIRQITSLEETLNKSEFKNSIRNYRQSLYEHVVLKKVVIDLDTYCNALEKALLEYHSEKMRKINSLIKELWRSIYRGNDIDYIEIKTDNEIGGSSSKRRSYNYRVIQSKNDVELDMRGRCSAGQRVLACLIIRIALAETFSSNCGVLALDEPTTNLDRANIESLCEVLNKIIEEREMQSNFMLIIITHDETFMQELKDLTNFYKVSRNLRGKSVIENKAFG